MTAELIRILLTALLAAAVTWGLAYAWFRVRLKKELDALEQRLAEEVERRVYQGAVQAGQELLPDFRREVTQGFKDALVSTARGDLVEEAAKTMAERGVGLVGGLLGGKKPR